MTFLRNEFIVKLQNSQMGPSYGRKDPTLFKQDLINTSINSGICDAQYRVRIDSNILVSKSALPHFGRKHFCIYQIVICFFKCPSYGFGFYQYFVELGLDWKVTNIVIIVKFIVLQGQKKVYSRKVLVLCNLLEDISY